MASTPEDSTSTSQIIAFLKEIKRRYGVPLAVVHDMGPGILAAVKAVFPGVPDFICHFHFLRDLGKDLLQTDEDALRKRLRHHGITEKLQAQARRLKAAIDEQPDAVEILCQNVQAETLTAAQADHRLALPPGPVCDVMNPILPHRSWQLRRLAEAPGASDAISQNENCRVNV